MRPRRPRPTATITARPERQTRDRDENMRSMSGRPQRLRLRYYDPMAMVVPPAPIYYYSRGDGGMIATAALPQQGWWTMVVTLSRPTSTGTRPRPPGTASHPNACRRNTHISQCAGRRIGAIRGFGKPSVTSTEEVDSLEVVRERRRFSAEDVASVEVILRCSRGLWPPLSVPRSVEMARPSELEEGEFKPPRRGVDYTRSSCRPHSRMVR